MSSQVVENYDGLAGKYLTFELGNEVYGLEILKVQEIIGMMLVTRVPRTPDFVRGVINLRGKVIPVVDLRKKFSMAVREDTEKTCIIVVQVAQEGSIITMGIIVDEVSEVLDIVADQIEGTPDFGTELDADFIMGMGKIENRVIMLLEIDRVLSGGEIDVMSKIK
jgi:purine-binding chemotaxis protein CheW